MSAIAAFALLKLHLGIVKTFAICGALGLIWWAIGTGLTATKEQAEEVHKYIRELLTKMYDADLANAVRIQYGGSVKPENIKELILQEDVDGALVGGASLKADSFSQIVKNCL